MEWLVYVARCMPGDVDREDQEQQKSETDQGVGGEVASEW